MISIGGGYPLFTIKKGLVAGTKAVGQPYKPHAGNKFDV